MSAAAMAVAAAVSLPLTACGKQDGPVDPAAKGRSIYSVHCIACHHPDPARDGALGPSVAGSSLELLQARVVRGEYPPGYKPKRDTHIMQRLPLTEDDIKALHAFLNPASP